MVRTKASSAADCVKRLVSQSVVKNLCTEGWSIRVKKDVAGALRTFVLQWLQALGGLAVGRAMAAGRKTVTPADALEAIRSDPDTSRSFAVPHATIAKCLKRKRRATKSKAKETE